MKLLKRHAHFQSNGIVDYKSSNLSCSLFVVIQILFWIELLTFKTTQCQFVEIQSELGRIRGVQFRTHYNNPAIAFLGIPYALPPIGERRFKKPVPYPKWSPKTMMATHYKSCCPQLDINGVPHGDENCLHLNVFVPLQSINQNPFSLGSKRFPVMIYLQGESFENGDSAVYGAEHLLDWEVVVVTFNYRLGVLGFLSTGDEQASGNWGLYDQLEVLRWVHNHIESFSGNPSLITIFGQGAGASSAFIHLVSPLSTGLFHRVIAQSGSPLCSWSIENNPEHASQELARWVGCPFRLGSSEIVRCLRKAPLSNLLRAQQQGRIFGEYPHQMVPVVEQSGPMGERLVPAHPKVLINQGNYKRVPLMMGYNKDETAFLYPLILSKQFIGDSGTLRYYLENKLLPRFIRATILDRNSFPETSNSNLIKLKTNSKDIERDIAQNILFKYFNFLNGKNYTDLAVRFVNMSTDSLYSSCIDETIRMYSAATSTSKSTILANKANLLLPFANVTYKYVFDYRGKNSMLSLILSGNHLNRQSYSRSFVFPINPDFSRVTNSAVCHGDELFYLFNLKFSSRKPEDNRDTMMQRKLILLWTDFAKHGFAPSSVSTEIPHWPPYTNAKTATYFISEQLNVIEGYQESNTHFWTRYLPTITSTSNSASASIIHKPNFNRDDLWMHSNERSNYYDASSITKLKTFAWSMLTLSLILLILVIVLLALLYYQRRKQTFSAESAQRARQTSAKALARALATSTTRTSSSTSGLY